MAPEGQARLMESIHTRRLGHPQDIANAVMFLASDAAGWISGQIISVGWRTLLISTQTFDHSDKDLRSPWTI